ncbi:MAG TPA: amidohydrolase family protein [Caulobacteraceae bacterium]|jgi:imidazolonepropionase-like amidohydrolase|nr:amidohydrolase family protein [Caulobacteraceae bacterium]
MKKLIPALALGAAASLAASSGAAAQDMAISNARIIVGTGQVIEKGSILVKDGKIASVAAGPAKAVAKGARTIDGTGMTLIAGYIDDHRHLVGGRGPAVAKWMADEAPARMRELLEAGFTTVQSGGDDNAGILELKKKIEAGQIKGPRIIASGQVPTARMKDEAEVRAAVRKVIMDGADSIAEVHYPITEPPQKNKPNEQESRNLAAGIDEALRFGVAFQVHASAPDAMLGAVKIGAKKLVHTPHFGWLTDADAKAVKDAGALVSSCTGFGSPVFDVFNHDNKPTFRDGKPWPEQILDGEGRGREAGYKPVNGRTLFDNGVDYGFCTDTNYNAVAGFAHELKTLNLVFSPIDLVTILGKNSADFLDKTDRGMLQPGKLADILVLRENPLDGYWNFMTPVVVIKGGVVMIDKRGQPGAGKPMGKAS